MQTKVVTLTDEQMKIYRNDNIAEIFKLLDAVSGKKVMEYRPLYTGEMLPTNHFEISYKE